MNTLRRTIIRERIVGTWPIRFAQIRYRKQLARSDKPKREVKR